MLSEIVRWRVKYATALRLSTAAPGGVAPLRSGLEQSNILRINSHAEPGVNEPEPAFRTIAALPAVINAFCTAAIGPWRVWNTWNKFNQIKTLTDQHAILTWLDAISMVRAAFKGGGAQIS